MQKLVFIFFILFITPVFAQEVRQIQGVISQKTGEAIEFANIVAVDSSSSELSSYAVSSEKGEFQLSLEIGKTYLIKGSHLSFEEKEIYFKPLSKNSKLLLGLDQKNTELDEVKVEYEFPILIKGDTVVYNTDSFNKGDERKLKDVLGNLPGFEVEENGDVKVQGKKVDKVLVEGKPFFDGDSKLAVENLPASAVDKVELLRNFTEVGMMSKFDNSDRLALNIKLDEDKKNLFFGDIELAAGHEERAIAHSNTFFYNRKSNINLILDANNTGKQAFTAREYFRFGADMDRLSQGSGRADAGIVVDNNPVLSNNNAQEMRNALGAMNWNYTPGKISTYGFLLLGRSDNATLTNNDRTYIQNENQNRESLRDFQDLDNLNGLGKFSLNYEPSKNFYLSYELFGKFSDTENQRSLISNFNNFSENLESNEQVNPVRIDQNLSLYKSIGEKNLITLQGTMAYEEVSNNWSLSSSNSLNAFYRLMSDSSFSSIIQNSDISNQKYSLQANYFRVLNNTNHLNLEAGYNNDQQRIDSYNALMQNEKLNQNENQLRISNPYIGLNLRSKLGNLTINPGFRLHQFSLDLNNNSFSNQNLILPYLYAKYELTNNQDLGFRYSMTNSLFNVFQLSEEGIIESYNQIRFGNGNLRNAIYHDLSLNYFNFNMFSSFNISGGVNVQIRERDFTDSTNFNLLQSDNYIINSSNSNSVYTAFAMLEKTFMKFKIGANYQAIYSDFSNVIETQSNRNINFNNELGAFVEITFFNFLTSRFGYDLGVNSYQGLSINTEFFNHNPSLSLFVRYHKNLKQRIKVNYFNYRNREGSIQTEYTLIDTELEYNKTKSPWTFFVKGQNLSNTQFIRRDGLQQNIISTSTYFVLPRIILGGIRFDI